MKQLKCILCILLLWGQYILLFAQSDMRPYREFGCIMEYNGRNVKTPLAGVSISVDGASHAVSGVDGRFVLYFPYLKPGSPVRGINIVKEGYVIFNREVLDQWVISDSLRTFPIIMCKKDKFKAYFEKYYQLGDSSYKKKYLQAVAELDSLKAQYRLSEAEYKRQKSEQYEFYLSSMKELGKYADKFARIDLSILSGDDSVALVLLDEGKIHEAIELYKSRRLDLMLDSVLLLQKEVETRINEFKVMAAENKTDTDSLAQQMQQLIFWMEKYDKEGFDTQIEKMKTIIQYRNNLFETDP